ncbi:unnamed protein product [Ostreobium quekettii]|uniref:Ferric reductase NAD binding domain-containing protein n=1 Tax=Ostreobium quekettii TaxID=121088 RepID=A0A8S1ISS6_9CHLO|nr:unnamed protein product [Ostreobium quekettii]
MCFKKVGKWTSRLVREARAGRLTAARLVGPCGATPDIRSFQEHEYLVMVAGGIDITPLLTLLKNLAMANAKNRRKAEEKSKGAAVGDGAPGLQGRIVVVWTMEKISEVELMDEELFSFSRAHPDELELRIHYAGKSELDDWTGTMVPNEAAKPGIKLDLYDSEREAESGVGFWRTFVQEWIWRLSPTALPQHWGSLHLAVLHVAVFVAAVMGLILGATWHPEASRPGEGAPRGKVELVAISAMLMMAVGMATLGTFPAHLILYAKARRSATPGEPPIPTTLTSTTASWTEWTQDIEWSGLDLESVPVEISDTPVLSPMTIDWLKRNMVEGRPYVDDVLDDVSGKLSAEGTAGVITAGPKAMIDNVRVAVARRTPQFLLKTLQAYEPSEAS